MFNFTIIDTVDGTQVIDRNSQTSYDDLTPEQLLEYMEVDAKLFSMDMLAKKQRAEVRQGKYRRKIARSFLYRLACLCGLF